MNDLTALEALHESYIALTAFLFDFALCIVVLMQGGARKDAKSRFFSVSVVVTVSVFLSFFNFFLLHVDTGAPALLVLFLQLAAYMANIFVTYYLAVYLGGFFHENAVRKEIWTFNKILLIASGALLAIYFLTQILVAVRTGDVVYVSGWFRALVGYAIELYYMCFCLQFARMGHELNRRARWTIVVAFTISVISFAMQATLGARPLVNYLGVSVALLIFYFSAETPDYHKLQNALAELEEEKKISDEAKKQADAANRSKSEFLATMSHEIRTPINAVLGMNEMILRESEQMKLRPDDKDANEAFDNILTYAWDVDGAGKSLLSIINDILDFSKIEAGRMEIVKQPYRLSSVLNDVYNMILFRAREKNLAFDVAVDETLPDGMIGDKARIRQIMINLLSNAVKYTDKGSVSLSVTGKRRGESVDLSIAVSDTGIGIREEDISRLFTQFERVDLNRNNAVEGTGLGLTITANLARLMRGEIDVQSVYGEGSTFTVTLPQDVCADDAIGDFHEKLKQDAQEASVYQVSFRAGRAHFGGGRYAAQFIRHRRIAEKHASGDRKGDERRAGVIARKGRAL